MQKYKYPDPCDVITNHFISHNQLYPNYWQESEDRILTRLTDHLEQLSPEKRGRFLDAGCGGGRMLPRFAPYYTELMGIDPDTDRLAMARQLLKEKKGLEAKTTLYNCRLEEFNDNARFDLVLSSHILQHLPSEAIRPMLGSLVKLVRKEGLLAITTCHSVKPHDTYTKSYMNNDLVIEEDIPVTEFNRILGEKGVLPAHFFESRSFIKAVEKEGIRLIDFQVFHLTNKEVPAGKDADHEANLTPSVQSQYGRDMYLLFRKL